MSHPQTTLILSPLTTLGQ